MELIERETLKICKHDNGYGYCFLHEEYCPEGPCEDEKLIEYAPVAHGHWVTRYDGPYKQARKYCSACGKHSGLIKERPYCPNCGVRMDGGEGHEN